MIYIALFLEFFKIGMFSFGGAYGAIPLIRQCVLDNGWMTDDMFANVLAISESTPGPIMVNTATYIGNSQAGVLGAAVATFGVVLPAFMIIILVTAFFGKWLKSKNAQCILRGVKPCLMGVILATGVYMAYSIVWDHNGVDRNGLGILVLLILVLVFYQKIRRKEISPILLIVVSAFLGAVLY